MKIVAVIVLLFLVLGIYSLMISIIEDASLSIILFQMGYLILASSFGYIVWTKQRNG